MKKLLALSALAALSMAGAAQAAQVVFGVDSVTTPVANPTVNTAPGSTVTMTVWAKRTGTAGFVNALGLDVKATAAGTATPVVLSNVNFIIDNPNNGDPDPDAFLQRWDSVVAPSYNTSGVSVFDARGFTVAASPAATYLPIQGTFRKVGTLTFTATQSVDLYLGVSPFWISESTSTTTSNFGFGDAAIASTGQAASNTFSALADATVLVPEPATMSLLGLGALGLVARRRRA